MLTTCLLEYFLATCSRVKLPKSCQNGGYQDPNNCKKCKCPDGLGGTYCDGVDSSSYGMYKYLMSRSYLSRSCIRF